MGWQVGAIQTPLVLVELEGEHPPSRWHTPTLALVEETLLPALGSHSSFHRAHLWLDEEVPGRAHQRWCLLLRDGRSWADLSQSYCTSALRANSFNP